MLRYRFLFALSLSIFFLGIAVQSSYSQENDLKNGKLLYEQAEKLYQQGYYADATPIAEKALAIREKVLGPDHPDVAQSLNGLGRLHLELSNFDKVKPLYQRALTIYEKTYGPENPNIAKSLMGLGEFYALFLGDLKKAESLLKKALAITKKAYVPDHLDVSEAIFGLASVSLLQGEYESSKQLYEESLSIRERILGRDHKDVGEILTLMGVLYWSLLNLDKSEVLFKRALAIYEKCLRPEHPKVAETLSSLGLIYSFLGDYDQAESLFRRSLTIFKKTFGQENVYVGNVTQFLGDLYYSTNNYDKAINFYKRALAIYEKLFGPEHYFVAINLNKLGKISKIRGDYVKFYSYYKRSSKIIKKTFGVDHPNYAVAAHELVNTFVLRNSDNIVLKTDLAKINIFKKFYTTIGSTYVKAFGPRNLVVAALKSDAAKLYGLLSEFETVHNLLVSVLKIETDLIDQVMGFTSEDQKIEFLSSKKWQIYELLSLVAQHLSQNPTARKDAFNAWLKRKGVILEAQKRFQEALIYSDDPQAIKTFQKLSRVRTQLSRLTFADLGKQDIDTYKKKIAYLESQKQELETKLSRLSQAYALSKKIAKADCEKIAKSLPDNTVLIDFARVEMFNFKAKEKEKKWLAPHYLAFILHSGKGNKVGMVDLGNAEKIDKAVTAFKKEISNIKDVKDGKPIKASGKVYDLVFEPLKKDLGDIKEIFISPDGNLNLIPFEVIQGPDGRYLIEDYTFNYLAAGRDLLRFGQIKNKGDKALLMGDPDFDMGTDEKTSTLRKLALAKVDHKGMTRRSSDMKEFNFSRLPGARQEVKAIQSLLGEDKSELYTGKQALEEVLRLRGTPSILHLATHGFFLKDQDLDNIPPDSTARGFDSFSIPVKRKGVKVRIENPMLRSGFALAGANKSLQVMDEQMDDGIVTSEEILGLRLRGTDMVVLSACDTGLGDVSTGEGVFGLRRAFAQAGAKSLIMSMWSVPDKETRELMIEFYKNIKSSKMNRCQALRQAALKEMKIVKKRYGQAYPICWGGFVMVGDPGQLN